MALTSEATGSELLDQVLKQIAETPGVTPDSPEYGLLVAKASLQFQWGGKVIAYRLVSGWENGGFLAKYQVVDDEGGTIDQIRARLAGRSDVLADDVEIDYIEPLDAEPDDGYLQDA